jgi:DNA-binding transcriptional MerR regulator
MPALPVTAASSSYTIGELAREFDLTTRAIRFYEDSGLLSPQRGGAGGRQRVYTARDRTRLKLTLRGKRLGLSLAEIKELVDMYESPRDSGPQLRKYLGVLAQHRAQIESQMADLQATLDEVAAHEKEARRLLAATEGPRPVRGGAAAPL